MKRVTKLHTPPAPLDSEQVRTVLDLLDLHLLAPQETAATFDRLGQSGEFSEGQLEAVQLLFELDEHQVGDALMTLADDEAHDLVREQMTLEARGFVAA